MPRPTNKLELIELSVVRFNKLHHLFKTLSQEQLALSFPGQYMNRNVRDVFGHLHHWHLLFLDWYTEGMAGRKPDMPAKGYTWKTTSELNEAIRKQYSEVPLEDVFNLFHVSHEKIQTIIEAHSNEDLFEKKRYHWTGSTSLGQYLISATSSHYDWAWRLIKKALIVR